MVRSVERENRILRIGLEECRWFFSDVVGMKGGGRI